MPGSAPGMTDGGIAGVMRGKDAERILRHVLNIGLPASSVFPVSRRCASISGP